MNLPTAGFKSELLRLYRVRPCRLLPNALWKTVEAISQSGVNLTVSVEDQQVTRLQASDGSRLLLYWDRFQRQPPFQDVQLYEFALLHNEYAGALPQFESREDFFRLRHRGKVAPAVLPPGFAFAPVDPQADADIVADLICRCYENMSLSPATVSTWAERPVYAPDLWAWIIDVAKDQPAALGVCELDPAVPEVSLEWIQVLPEYWRRGLGNALVNELLRRAVTQAELVTVSGRVKGHPQAEGLYRRAGFAGDDVWWVLRR